MNHAEILVLAMILDAIAGEPEWLWHHAPHPAVIMGRAIAFADEKFNRGAAIRTKGIAVVVGLVATMYALGSILSALPFGAIVDVLIAAILLAQRSLVQHVRAVSSGLRISVAEGRKSVARIVGRDTADMDGPAITRSAIESAAENLSDGIIAPLFWFLILGLPGLLVYKIVNTADSMIGYKTPRHQDFGWAAARLDDVLNLIPARLTAILILAGNLQFSNWKIVLRDAGLHRSPNAGWPESAMAVGLGIALSGPRSYDGKMRDFPWVNPDGRRDPGPADIDAAATILWRSWALALVLILLVAIA